MKKLTTAKWTQGINNPRTFSLNSVNPHKYKITITDKTC